MLSVKWTCLYAITLDKSYSLIIVGVIISSNIRKSKTKGIRTRMEAKTQSHPQGISIRKTNNLFKSCTRSEVDNEKSTVCGVLLSSPVTSNKLCSLFFYIYSWLNICLEQILAWIFSKIKKTWICNSSDIF